MKLAKIRHYRCDEPQETTLVWVPDEMTEEQLDALIARACRECLDAEHNFKGTTEPKYKTWWDFLKGADKTRSLGWLEAEYAVHEANYRQWLAEREAARKSFSARLHTMDTAIKPFWDEDCPLEMECSWGHNHGVKVDYGETDF